MCFSALLRKDHIHNVTFWLVCKLLVHLWHLRDMCIYLINLHRMCLVEIINLLQFLYVPGIFFHINLLMFSARASFSLVISLTLIGNVCVMSDPNRTPAVTLIALLLIHHWLSISGVCHKTGTKTLNWAGSKRFGHRHPDRLVTLCCQMCFWG